MHLVDEVGQDLGVGVAGQIVAPVGEQFPQCFIVFDDPVVDHGNFAIAPQMRMGIAVAGRSVSGPTRVANANCALRDTGTDVSF